MLFAELASDFDGELVVGGGPFREPPTVMQSTVLSRRIGITPREPRESSELRYNTGRSLGNIIPRLEIARAF